MPDPFHKLLFLLFQVSLRQCIGFDPCFHGFFRFLVVQIALFQETFEYLIECQLYVTQYLGQFILVATQCLLQLPRHSIHFVDFLKQLAEATSLTEVLSQIQWDPFLELSAGCHRLKLRGNLGLQTQKVRVSGNRLSLQVAVLEVVDNA